MDKKLSLDSQNGDVSLGNTKLMRSSFQKIRVFVGIASSKIFWHFEMIFLSFKIS